MSRPWVIKTDNTADAKAAVRAGGRRGLTMALEHILGVSRDQVPHEEATLERSGKAGLVSDTKGGVSYDTPYAVIQHEDMTLAHDPGRNAKYLENAFNSERSTAAKIIATQIKNELG